jgi:hypothetical protein
MDKEQRMISDRKIREELLAELLAEYEKPEDLSEVGWFWSHTLPVCRT